MADSPNRTESPSVQTSRTSIAIRLGLLGAGALIAVVLALVRATPVGKELGRVSIPTPVALWIADRDGCAVYGLDEDLILARRVAIDWPIAVVGRPDGGAWILRSVRGSPGGPAKLLRLDAEGSISSERDLPACAGLSSLVDGSAVVLEQASDGNDQDRVVRFDQSGGVEIVHRNRSLTCVAGSKGSIVAGDAQGVLVRVSIDPVGAVITRADLRESILEIEPDPLGDSLWVLTDSGGATIHRLDADLVVQWSAEAGSSSTTIASHGDSDTIWLVDGTRSMVRRLGVDGTLEFESGGLPIVGTSRAVRGSRGGLSIASPGCFLHLDSNGRIRAGLGGFAHLVDVDRVR